MLIWLKKIIYKKAKENIAESLIKNRHACLSKNKKKTQQCIQRKQGRTTKRSIFYGFNRPSLEASEFLVQCQLVSNFPRKIPSEMTKGWFKKYGKKKKKTLSSVRNKESVSATCFEACATTSYTEKPQIMPRSYIKPKNKSSLICLLCVVEIATAMGLDWVGYLAYRLSNGKVG